MRGTEIPNHRAKMATRVPKGIAAEEPSTQRIRFMRKKSANTILGERSGGGTIKQKHDTAARKHSSWRGKRKGQIHCVFVTPAFQG